MCACVYVVCSLNAMLEPGDLIAFHGLTVHGATGNQSNTSARRAFSMRWVGDDATIARRPWTTSPPVTGGLAVGTPMSCSEDFPLIFHEPSS